MGARLLLQRRHQKVIEEAPAPGMDAALRAEWERPPWRRRARSAMSVPGRWSSSPTGEMVEFWFMEMNTRLQVEHPVTEMITGLIWWNGSCGSRPVSRCH